MTNENLFDWAEARAFRAPTYTAAAGRITGVVDRPIYRVRDVEQVDRLAPMGPQPPDVVPRATSRLLINSDWARIGGREFEPMPTPRFAGRDFKARWEAGPYTRAIYAGACEGLATLSRALHLPIYKVSTTSAKNVWSRMQQLRVDRYGAARRSGGDYVVDSGWNSWFPSHLKAREFPSPDSPVILADRAILVPLPPDLAPEEFDRRFDAEAEHGALDRWLLTQAGRDHVATLGVDPAIGQRLTAYPGGLLPRLSPAEEIMIFSCCYSGPDRAIAIAENILLQHLGLER